MVTFDFSVGSEQNSMEEEQFSKLPLREYCKAIKHPNRKFHNGSRIENKTRNRILKAISACEPHEKVCGLST